MNSDSYYIQPDSMFCDECDLCMESDECQCNSPEHDNGCNMCGRERGCSCDEDYEHWRDSQLD